MLFQLAIDQKISRQPSPLAILPAILILLTGDTAENGKYCWQQERHDSQYDQHDDPSWQLFLEVRRRQVLVAVGTLLGVVVDVLATVGTLNEVVIVHDQSPVSSHRLTIPFAKSWLPGWLSVSDTVRED
jgi:hypothetical protein